MIGQSIGPVFGGLITQFFDFRAIFWFLLILGATSLVTFVLLLHETLRSVAGNGTVRLTGFQRPLIYNLKPQPDAIMEPNNVTKRKVVIMSILAPLRFLFEKDVFISLFFGSIVYTGMRQLPLLLVQLINISQSGPWSPHPQQLSFKHASTSRTSKSASLSYPTASVAS